MTGAQPPAGRRFPRGAELVARTALVLGVLGGLVGLVLGLVSHPPTAWFAVLEVGVPATLLGLLVGLGLALALAVRDRRGR